MKTKHSRITGSNASNFPEAVERVAERSFQTELELSMARVSRAAPRLPSELKLAHSAIADVCKSIGGDSFAQATASWPVLHSSTALICSAPTPSGFVPGAVTKVPEVTKPTRGDSSLELALPSFTETTPPMPRPLKMVAAIDQAYPWLWDSVDVARSHLARRGLRGSYDMCFVPEDCVELIIAMNKLVGRMSHPADMFAGLFGTAAAWRATKGVYRFNPSTFDALCTSSVDGDIPAEPLSHMPEWCVYLETPGLKFAGLTLDGFLAMLQSRMDERGAALHLILFLPESEAFCIRLPLGNWSILSALERTTPQFHLPEASARLLMPELERRAKAGLRPPDERSVCGGETVERQVMRRAADDLVPLISLLLYICEVPSDVKQAAPEVPKRKWSRASSKPSKRTGPPPTVWEVGTRLGATLGAARAAADFKGGGNGHAGPRAHVRRAHWHTVRVGPKRKPDGTGIPTSSRKSEARWFPPIAVKPDATRELPAVVRRVKKKV